MGSPAGTRKYLWHVQLPLVIWNISIVLSLNFIVLWPYVCSFHFVVLWAYSAYSLKIPWLTASKGSRDESPVSLPYTIGMQLFSSSKWEGLHVGHMSREVLIPENNKLTRWNPISCRKWKELQPIFSQVDCVYSKVSLFHYLPFKVSPW